MFFKGCLNGGAQCRSSDTTSSNSRELSVKLERQYHGLPVAQEENETSHIYDYLGSPDSELYKAIMYTQFHAIEKLPNVGLKW